MTIVRFPLALLALALVAVAQDPAPQDVPRKAFAAAVAAAKWDEAQKLLDQVASAGAEPGVVEALRARLSAAQASQDVRRALDAGRAAAETRVRDAREALAREFTEEAERDGRLSKIFKEITDRAPLKVRLAGDVLLDQVKVAAYAAGRFKLVWPQGELEVPLDLLPDDTRAVLLAGLLPSTTPRDQLEVGRLLLRAKDFDRAARWFESAAKKDPALAPFCPDLDRIRKSARLFEGTFRAVGSTLSLRWTFSGADEPKDFLAFSGTAMTGKPGQGLEVDGPKLALAAVRDIPFRDRVKASALGKETDGSAHVLGLRFIKPGGGDVLIYGALVTSLKAFLVQRVEDGKVQELLPLAPGAAGNRLSLDFDHGRFVYKVGEKTVWSGNEGGFTEVAVILGALPVSFGGKPAGRAQAVFREVTLLGGVDPVWMGKKLGAYREALASELAKEHALRVEGTGERTLALSVDPALARASDAVRAAWPGALDRVRAALRSREPADLAEARRQLEPLAPYAPALHYLGVIDEASGDARGAADRYEQAIAALPEFPEALCARAHLKALEGRWPETLGLVEKALALKPDLGEGHLLSARLWLEEGDPAAALEAARLARRLSPLDPKVQVRAQTLANVARGPRWAKPSAHESAHYLVNSDLSPAKCRAYAEHLEAVRTVYEEVLGRAAPAGRKAPVLIFDAEEGYYSYMDFTVGDRQEHTLGAFSPWHGQMALFEDADAEETLHVLAHEGFHQYLHRIAPSVPIWFNEGMAEYVGATRVEKGKVVDASGLQPGRLADLKAGVRFGWTTVPFEKLMTESQAEFYGKHAPLKYAQAWSMIHYFRADAAGGKELLRAYVARLLEGDTAKAAFASTFGKADLAALEAGWRKHHALPAPGAPAWAPAPAAAKPAIAEGTVDLLALLRTRGLPLREWILRDDGLTSRRDQGSAPVDLGFEPSEEYDLRLTVLRPNGTGGLRIGLMGGGRTFVLELDGFQGTYLDRVDGKGPIGNETVTKAPTLPPGAKRSVEVSVRRTGLRATVDGKPVVEWKGRYDRLSAPPDAAWLSGKRTLFVAADRGEFQISEMVVAPAKAALPAAAAVPEPGAKAAPTVKELREKVASKSEETRIEAVTQLGKIREKEARQLLAERLASDTEKVRRAAAQALSKQKHPQAVEALDKAIRAQVKSPALVNDYIRALGELDMCGAIPVLVGLIELEGGQFARSALAELRSIGCVEACAALAGILKRAESELKKPEFMSTGLPNPNRDQRLAQLFQPLRQTLQAIAGTGPGPNETWSQFVGRGGVARKLVSVHLCGTTGKTFDVPTGKSLDCPHVEGPKPSSHEDTFLKHRPE